MTEDTLIYLNKIEGEAISKIGRAGNVMWIGIGPSNLVTNFRGDNVIKSKYALHVQASWRMMSEKEKIIFASSDFYIPREQDNWTEDFNWDIQGANLFDEKAAEWIKRVEPIHVRKIEIDRIGDLKVIFSNEDRLEIFIDSSTDIESWRLFEPYSNKKHLVVSASGIEFN